MKDKKVLNRGPLPETVENPDVAAWLAAGLGELAVVGEPDRGRVDYPALVASPVFRRFQAETARLRQYDPGDLGSLEERLAFWINLYNGLVLHGVAALGIAESLKEVPDFFSRIGYDVGGEVFTPDDIRHGILRANQRQPYGLFQPFADGDPRCIHVIDPPDPRIHFALSGACRSSPRFAVYDPRGLREQLDRAASRFINSPQVEIVPRKNLLFLSPLFKWYRLDFGGYEGMIDLLIRYMDHGQAKDFLIERGLGAEVTWLDFDWRLNT
jgi:hypothetical protein